MLFRILLYQYRRRRGIQCKREERTGSIRIGHFHVDIRITDSGRQLCPRLANDGGSLKTYRIHIRVLIQIHCNAAVTIAGSGRHPFYPFDAGQHGLQLTRRLHLYYPRRGTRHIETHRETRQRA